MTALLSVPESQVTRAFLTAPMLVALVLLATAGCSPPGNAQPTAWDPAEVFMAKHISRVHGVYVSKELGADVVVRYDGKRVRVTLSPTLIKRTDGEILQVLDLHDEEEGMEKREYLVLLNKLHAYLTLTPLRDGE